MDDVRGLLSTVDYWRNNPTVALTKVLRPAAQSIRLGRIRSDASDTGGYGAWWPDAHVAVWGRWRPDQLEASIQYKELYTVLAALQAWGPNLRGQMVRLECDIQADCHMINSGRSRSEAVTRLLRAIHALARQHGFIFYADWNPQERNVEADALSKASSLTHASASINSIDPRRSHITVEAAANFDVSDDGSIVLRH